MTITVMMVAEKPSLAASIALHLSGGKVHSRRSALDVHEYEGTFHGRSAHFRMTSVIGHVLSIDFPAKFQNWDTTDPSTLFDAPTMKNESNPKAHICRHLQSEAKGCDYLVLWLDCDREGENICFEVMDNTLRWMHKVQGQQVFRARFSAITAPEIRAAMNKLGEPNKNEALSVDARQELDLKVGVAFTRFQTRFFQGKYGNLDASVVSYGPCQTPTLNFCVERHQKIAAFQPEPFWVARPHVSKGGQGIALEWGRGRLFDVDVAQVFRKVVADGQVLKVTCVTEKEERRGRPHGLNTVELLKVASSALNMGPAHAMQIAERLYTSGYLSYPRTESTAYPTGFDFREVLAAQRRHPTWGDYTSAIMANDFTAPKGGADVGDHPPITPMVMATEHDLDTDSWRIYDYVTRHFLGSVSDDCVYRRTKASFSCAGESFTATGTAPVRPGFTAVMPWRALEGQALPPLAEGESLPMKQVELHQGKTSAPDYLTESELISQMEKYGIGTDASIPVHINNICERNYVTVQSGRRVVPTELGITLVKGYQLIDPELCRPQVRSHVEVQIGMIAKGQADKDAVVAHTLQQFKQKFLFFVAKVARMDALFEASFSPLASSGKPLSKCGKCKRYMKYISQRPSRLYCPSCEEVYPVPQGAAIKLYKGLACPLDDFELLLCSLSGPDGMTYPLCPFCYSNPPFEGIQKGESEGSAGKGGMPCTLCPHPKCKHSMIRQGVSSCPECDNGTLVLDPVSAPKWRVDCNRCSLLIYLPPELHNAKLANEHCQDCDSKLLVLDWKKGKSPLQGNQTEYTGCVVCDELLQPLCEVKHGRSYAKRPGRGGRRGRARGRGRGRGRGRRGEDPKMSFREF